MSMGPHVLVWIHGFLEFIQPLAQPALCKYATLSLHTLVYHIYIKK